MIYQVLENEEVTKLKSDLQNELPGSAKIFYILTNYLRGLLEGFEVIVDRWPEWTSIVLRPMGVDKAPSYFRHFYICHTRSVSALKYFIQRPGVVDWTRPATFTGVPCDLVSSLQDRCRKRGGHLSSIEPRFMYAWTKKQPPEEPAIPDGLKLTTLKPEHVAILRQDWKDVRGDAGLDTYFQRVIDNFDTSALVSDDGELKAYICMQFNGSMAMLWVPPEHKGKGYGKIILRDLTRKLVKKEEIAFGFVPTKDTSLLDTTHKMGFTWVPQGNMSWLRYHPTTSKETSQKSKEVTTALAHCQGTEERVGSDLFINAIPLIVEEMKEPSIKSAKYKVGIS